MTEVSENKTKPLSSRPTIQTPFRIDFEWWKGNDYSWKVILKDYLCEEHASFFSDHNDVEFIDIINPETAEVTQSDAVTGLIFSHCSHVDSFIPENAPLTESVFRLFLANRNKPLTPEEIASKIDHSADMVLKALTGGRVYRGIRPFNGNS